MVGMEPRGNLSTRSSWIRLELYSVLCTDSATSIKNIVPSTHTYRYQLNQFWESRSNHRGADSPILLSIILLWLLLIDWGAYPSGTSIYMSFWLGYDLHPAQLELPQRLSVCFQFVPFLFIHVKLLYNSEQRSHIVRHLPDIVLWPLELSMLCKQKSLNHSLASELGLSVVKIIWVT